jgi:hypothetical protein
MFSRLATSQAAEAMVKRRWGALAHGGFIVEQILEVWFDDDGMEPAEAAARLAEMAGEPGTGSRARRSYLRLCLRAGSVEGGWLESSFKESVFGYET